MTNNLSLNPAAKAVNSAFSSADSLKPESDTRQDMENKDNVTSFSRLSLPPFQNMITGIFVFLLILAFFTGVTYKFYASFLFLFYGWLKKMWVSVVCLGIFQTALLIPFRIISLRQETHTKEFEEKIEEIQTKKEQRLLFKKGVKKGETTLLWYLINFMVQTISYFSLGRLFLTDFYNQPLNPKLLYSFVSYPEYPIQNTFFKIPYMVFNKTIDLGMSKVWIFWLAALVYKIITAKLIPYLRKNSQRFEFHRQEERFPFGLIKKIIKLTNGSVILWMFLGWLIIRHFPTNWELRIFSGDVGKPNSTFNMITAITTFLIIIWLDIPKILQKIRMADIENISQTIINKTQVKLFENSFKKAVFLGLGAYFITNMIPCAFELSVFTLEMISFLSPLTLDKLILRTQKKG